MSNRRGLHIPFKNIYITIVKLLNLWYINFER